MALWPWTRLCVGDGIKRDACTVRRNFGQRALRNFPWMRTVRVSNEDPFAAFLCDFPVRGANECGKRDANTDRNNELFHAFGAFTLGKRAFLIRSFKFFPSVDIR